MTRPRLHPAFPLLLAALACGGGSGPSGPGPGPGPDGIGPAGGTVSLGEQASVRVPAGALATTVEITVESASVPASLQAEGAFAPAFRFGPAGQQFALPVEVEILVPDAALGGRDPADLTLLSTGGTNVEALSAVTRTVVAGGVRLRGTTTHFSVIAPAGPTNEPPTVDLGADRTVAIGTAVTVQAATDDPDGDPVSVAWTLASQPAGSAAALTGSTGGSTGFTPDVAGDYTVRAEVSDGAGGAATATVVITAVAVVADAGPDQTTVVGSTVLLDARGSMGDDLVFSWRFLSMPGATPALQGGDGPTPSFVPADPGVYVLEVTVRNDVATARDTVRVTVSPPNRAPAVGLSVDPQVVFLGSSATVTATVTDPDGDPTTLTFQLQAPPGSTASLGVSGNRATVVPDVPGTYVVTAFASDGEDTGQAEIGVAGNPMVAGSYDATFEILGSSTCVSAGTATGVLPILQPSPGQVVVDLPGLDPTFLSRPNGTLTGDFFFFQGNVTIDLGDGQTASIPGTLRGTMDGASLDLDFNATVSILGCTINGKITGPKAGG